MKEKLTYKKLFQYFLQGLIILAPVTVTGYLIYWLFTKLDNLIPIYINLSGPNKPPFYLPGIGFILVVSLVMVVGYLSSFFLISRAISFFDHWLEKAPGIKNIYSVVKDFSEAFAGKKRKFKVAVLVSPFKDDIWQIGFLTNEDLQQFGFKEHVAVYVPQSYAIAGQLFLVARDKIKLITDVSAADALKFAISGGVVEVDEQ